jgi:hypothetical protein
MLELAGDSFGACGDVPGQREQHALGCCGSDDDRQAMASLRHEHRTAVCLSGTSTGRPCA